MNSFVPVGTHMCVYQNHRYYKLRSVSNLDIFAFVAMYLANSILIPTAEKF